MIPIQTTIPTRYPAFVTWTLITVNCLVFFVQLGLSPAELEEFFLHFALIPARYSLPSVYGSDLAPSDFVPFITMMFLHGGWLHLIMNMWMLWLFGPAIEDRLGHGSYFLFYLGCGIAASLVQMASDPYSVIPAVGASGAIAGVGASGPSARPGRPRAVSPGGRISVASWPDCSLDPCFISPNAVIAPTSPTKAFLDSTPGDADDRASFKLNGRRAA